MNEWSHKLGTNSNDEHRCFSRISYMDRMQCVMYTVSINGYVHTTNHWWDISQNSDNTKKSRKKIIVCISHTDVALASKRCGDRRTLDVGRAVICHAIVCRVDFCAVRFLNVYLCKLCTRACAYSLCGLIALFICFAPVIICTTTIAQVATTRCDGLVMADMCGNVINFRATATRIACTFGVQIDCFWNH